MGMGHWAKTVHLYQPLLQHPPMTVPAPPPVNVNSGQNASMGWGPQMFHSLMVLTRWAASQTFATRSRQKLTSPCKLEFQTHPVPSLPAVSSFVTNAILSPWKPQIFMVGMVATCLQKIDKQNTGIWQAWPL